MTTDDRPLLPTAEGLNRASRSLLAEMHPCADRDNGHSTPGGTWHMSRNRMGSILAAIEAESRAAALRELRREVEMMRTMWPVECREHPAPYVEKDLVLAEIDRMLEP
jgi:hypothetical protein